MALDLKCLASSPFTCYRQSFIEPTANQYDTVALLRDRNALGLVIGQVGTIVEIYAPDASEVESRTSNGSTIAPTELTRADFLVLRLDAVLAA